MDRGRALGRGRLSGPAVEALYGRSLHMSASRIDQVKRCHFGYFMQYGLRARDRRPAGFEAPEIGTFIHYLLENVAREVKTRGGWAAVQQPELRQLVREYTDRYAREEIDGYQEKSARFRYLFSRLRTAAYAIVEDMAGELAQSDFSPVAFELGFGGKDGQLPAVTITEGDQRLSVSGKVDRVDGWLHDGRLYLRVVDYKTGKKSFDLSDLRYGLGIQMLLYLFTLEQEGRSYFGYPIVPAGVLYHPAREVILKADRGIQPEKLQLALQSALRRSGMVLSDPQVLRAMEHSALESPHYLPIKVKKDGSIADGVASGFLVGVETARRLLGQAPMDFPRETAIGALGLYVSNESVTQFQPMNINFGIMPPLDHRVKGKRNKNAELSQRSLAIIEQLKQEVLSYEDHH